MNWKYLFHLFMKERGHLNVKFVLQYWKIHSAITHQSKMIIYGRYDLQVCKGSRGHGFGVGKPLKVYFWNCTREFWKIEDFPFWPHVSIGEQLKLNDFTNFRQFPPVHKNWPWTIFWAWNEKGGLMSAAERRRIPIFAQDSNPWVPWDPQTLLTANKNIKKMLGAH